MQKMSLREPFKTVYLFKIYFNLPFTGMPDDYNAYLKPILQPTRTQAQRFRRRKYSERFTK